MWQIYKRLHSKENYKQNEKRAQALGLEELILLKLSMYPKQSTVLM